MLFYNCFFQLTFPNPRSIRRQTFYHFTLKYLSEDEKCGFKDIYLKHWQRNITVGPTIVTRVWSCQHTVAHPTLNDFLFLPSPRVQNAGTNWIRHGTIPDWPYNSVYTIPVWKQFEYGTKWIRYISWIVFYYGMV